MKGPRSGSKSRSPKRSKRRSPAAQALMGSEFRQRRVRDRAKDHPRKQKHTEGQDNETEDEDLGSLPSYFVYHDSPRRRTAAFTPWEERRA